MSMFAPENGQPSRELPEMPHELPFDRGLVDALVDRARQGEGIDPLDGLLNASMILTGMGPVDPMKSDGGKWFASFYALYSGIAFVSIMAVITAPIFHRIMHRFHLEEDDDLEEDERQDDERRSAGSGSPARPAGKRRK